MANQGKDVTYVCDAGDIAEYGIFTMESFNNKRMLFEKGVKVYTSHWLDKIEPGKVRLSYLYKFGPDLTGPSSGGIPRKDNGGELDLDIDAVILVTSRRSDDRLWRELKARKSDWASNEIRDIFRTGDCKAPAQLNQALWDAHRLAREFDSPHPAYPLPWIRERQLWGGPTVPKLGDPRVNVEAE
jgi:dimethylamine/trimethylamine dehydrogenase